MTENEKLIEEAREVCRGPLTLTWPQIERLRVMVQCLVDALTAQSPLAPAVWKMVPVEPTEAMLTDAGTMEGFDTDRGDADRCHIAWWHAMLAFAPQAPALPTPSWRCFHCDEVFTDRECAAEHFGKYERDCDPICTVGAARYRDLEDQLAAYRHETDAASKEFYALGAKHTQELRRSEERGYESGLRDARHEEIYRAMLNAAPQPPAQPPDPVAEKSASGASAPSGLWSPTGFNLPVTADRGSVIADGRLLCQCGGLQDAYEIAAGLNAHDGVLTPHTDPSATGSEQSPLAGEVERLRKALEPFSKAAELAARIEGNGLVLGVYGITYEHFRAARDAYAATGEG